MLLRVRYEKGKLILLDPHPKLIEGQEFWIRVETLAHPIEKTAITVIDRTAAFTPLPVPVTFMENHPLS